MLLDVNKQSFCRLNFAARLVACQVLLLLSQLWFDQRLALECVGHHHSAVIILLQTVNAWNCIERHNMSF